MTQSKQQDKIQEIMGLVDQHHKCGVLKEAWLRSQIESKLRELVREPLSDEDIEKATGVKQGTPMFLAATGFVRATERAHNITSASGEA